jgi:biofilm PGA synthesis lipoprotein PgaB
MRWLVLVASLLACGTAAAQDSFRVLCYHEVRNDVRDYPDPFAVDSAALVRQFEWLRGNGYTPVSLGDILAARGGGKPLPAKAVLLSFDDAYLSFYTQVYPLLKAFRFPALLGVVGKWIDEPRGAAAPYGEKASVAEASFPAWGQLREMADSGLVEIASHTYDLHRGVPANPQGNLLPAATARIFDPSSGSYEGDAAWRARVLADLARNSNRIERETGRRPRAVVWPYGSYNGELVDIAGGLGMPVALTLDEGANTPAVPLTAVRRTLIEHNPALAEFALEVRGPLRPAPVRVVQLSLDAIYSANAAEQERNLSVLLDRIQVLKPSHVWLQATADPDRDGVAGAAYFPTAQLPVRADLFNRVAWQLSSRTDVQVFAVLPVDGLRLSHAQALEVYRDLARHASFDGLVFSEGSMAFTAQLAAAARRWRALKVARAYADEARAALDASSDYVVVAARAGRNTVSTSPTLVYMLAERPLPRRMRALQLGGALNFGYSGDDPIRDDPPLAGVAPVLSLRALPGDRQDKRP